MSTLARVREVWQFRMFWWSLVHQQALARYHGSALGVVWTLVHPLLTFLIFSLIFSALNGQSMREYGVYFLSGYIPWMFLSNCSSLAAESIVGNSVYVTRVRIPKLLLPLSVVTLQLVDVLACVVILFVFMLAAGAPFTAALLILPLSILLLVLLVAGVSIWCALANVFFRDFRFLLNSFLFLAFFLCPILWRAEGNERLAPLVAFNPVVPFLRLFQDPVSHGRWPAPETLVLAGALGLLAAVSGLLVFWRREKEFYFHV